MQSLLAGSQAAVKGRGAMIVVDMMPIGLTPSNSRIAHADITFFRPGADGGLLSCHGDAPPRIPL
jgi:hypothetical protein